jgi:hypothetical protein
MKRRVLAAGLAALAVGALLVVTGHGGSSTSGPDTVIRGHSWIGPQSVTESVADIASRQRAKDRRGGNRAAIVREKPDPVELAAEEGPQREEAGGERAATVKGAGGERAATSNGQVGEKPEPGEPPPRPRAEGQPLPQPRLGKSAIGPRSSFSTGTSFIGAQLSESNFIPPDTMGAVGPDQIIVDVNGRIKVFDKDGTLGGLDVTDKTFWTSVRGGQNVTDPGVEYDRLSGRWVVSAINTAPTNNRVMIAVSSGPHITNQTDFSFFEFHHNAPLPSHTGQFADYPQLGVDNNAVYIGVNDFLGSNFANSSLFVVQKSSLVPMGTPVVTGFEVASGFGPGPFSPQPATDMDPSVPAGYVVGADNAVFSQLDVLRVTNPGTASPTLSATIPVTVPSTFLPLNVPAQGTHDTLDAIDDRLFEAMIARGPDGSDSLWTAHNLRVNSSGVGGSGGDRDGARWYQLGDLTANPPTLIQSGTLFDTAASSPQFFWMPSIAMNGQGHASLSSSVAGTGRFAQVASSGRLFNDPLNTTQSPDITQTSSSVYDLNPASGFSSNKRWGDYSQTVVDPTDDQTFWTFQEYPDAANSWAVRVIQLKAPPPATPTAASPLTIPGGSSSETVQITGASTNGSGFFDPGPDTGGPGFSNHISATVSGGVNVTSVTYDGPTDVTLHLDTTVAAGGPADVTITNPDGQSAVGCNILVVDQDTTPPNSPNLYGTTPSSPGNSTSPKVNGAAECGSTVNLYTNDTCTEGPVGTGTATDFVSPGISASAAPNSTTTFWATATDVTGNISDCSSNSPSFPSVAYLEDSVAPVATVDSGPTGVTTDTTPTFTFSATDSFPPADPITFQCSIDAGTPNFNACSGPDSDSPATALADGSYTFRVKATDGAGNSSTATRTFTVQTSGGGGGTTTTTPPTATISPDTAIKKGPKKTSKRRPKFKFSSSQAGSSFQCQLDRGQFAPCTSPFQPRTKLSPGKHVLRVKAIGPTGVIDASPAVRKFKVLP